MFDNDFKTSETFKLGIFSSNCSGGMTPSTLDDGWEASWDKNLELAQMADKAGIDFMLPVARFIGLGGKKDFQGSVLDTITWATALLAKTEKIKIFTTLHTSMNHPIIAAKQISTMAQIGKGRVGVNIVAGWNKPEYDALGIHLPKDHPTRYRYAQEWFDLIKKTWASKEPFDWNGEFFQTKGSYGKPNLLPTPPIFNAAGSKEGREFALKNSDFLFTFVHLKLEDSCKEVKQLKDEAKTLGKVIKVLTSTHIICRPTEEEAQAEWKRQLENADLETVQHILDTLFVFSKAMPPELLASFHDRIATGFGGLPIVGTPEQVAEGLASLEEAGFSGCALSFFDYTKEFPFFRDYVMPILKERVVLSSSTEQSHPISKIV
ncbi:LLM class flavin-dependent oxidoreductase [Acinetobacter pittii]|uniref:LLM class flavin-dependent oxidoreductase n=1 Tax=Acinetobacter pittii TaxID=48296 RepID=UPI001EFC418B|nr:LLM class flavin-dependent oxidoreductase [Acinetobacter pittii]MCG9515218.1 LLM class flavin-dependent oxidoreductase [Acinetobacter pittii]